VKDAATELSCLPQSYSFLVFLLPPGRSLALLPVGAVIFQLLGVSVPEEVYFRGFLQHRLGNTLRAVLVASLLFSLMHLPQFIFYGDSIRSSLSSLLVMGLLYWRTSNILPSVIFHFFSNIVFWVLMIYFNFIKKFTRGEK